MKYSGYRYIKYIGNYRQLQDVILSASEGSKASKEFRKRFLITFGMTQIFVNNN